MAETLWIERSKNAYRRRLEDCVLTVACNWSDQPQPCTLFDGLSGRELISNYRQHEDGAYYDRYGKSVDAETAEAVLLYLSDKAFTDRLRAEADRLQAEVNAAFAADDPMMTALVSDGEISAMADRLADRYAGYIKQAASDLLAGIDRDVDDFIGSRPLKTGR